MGPLGGPDTPEIEAKRRIAGGLGDLPGSDDDRVVHFAAVERMGVAEHESADGGVEGLQPSLQGRSTRDADDGSFLHTDPDLRDSAGNIQAPAAVTAYEVYFF
jgi:hypothetical protein